MKKRTVSLLLAVIFVLSMSQVSFALKFGDVDSNFAWASEAIESLSEAGVISGYPDGTFKPGRDITKEEAVTLISKALGYNDEANEVIVNAANEEYAEDLESYTSYAVNQAAYLLYKNIMLDSEISTYMSSAAKGQAIKRYEAATLIARSLGADIWLKSKPDFAVPFIDADKVPASYLAYIYYVNDKKIMTGMDEDHFAPDGNVTRAQIAVMIDRIRKNMNFTYKAGVVSSIESVLNTVTFKDSEGNAESVNIGDDVIVTINGEVSKTEELENGVNIVLTRQNGKAYAIDAVKIIPDEDIEGIYKGKVTDNSGTTVKIADPATGDISEYLLAANAVILYEGSRSDISQFSANNYVYAQLKNGKIAILNGEPKTVTLTDLTVEAIEFDSDVKIKVRDKNDEVTSYKVKSNATLKRNGNSEDFSELAVGDKVNLTLEYGVIDSVVAFGTDKTITGTIEEITISRGTSYITVDTGSQTAKYALSRDAAITVDGEDGTIYDLRLGDEAQFKSSSASITSITVKSIAMATQITGTVSLVNSAYGMILVETVDSYGNVAEKQIFVKSTAKILDSTDGKVKTVKEIKTGRKIMAAGVVDTGIFEATSIMLLAD